MGFLPKNIFGGKKNPAPTLTEEAHKQGQEAKEKKSADKKTTPPSSRIESIMLVGHPLRIFRFENEWYYCIDDLVKAAGVENPDKYLLANSLAEVQLDEDGKKVTLQFATKQTINPIIKELDKLPQEIVLRIRSLN